MIYDCFTFFNELDLLELRFNILDDVVDHFVIVEASRTYSNQPKPLYFADHQDRFKKFSHKIIHIVVDDYPIYENSWSFEKHQRACIMRGLVNCQADDTILISDVDEIPNPNQILKYQAEPGLKIFKQKMFYYYLNNIDLQQPFWAYTSTKMLSFQELEQYQNNPQIVRFARGRVINQGGWHFSCLGGVEKIITKIQAFSHQEYNRPPYTDADWIRKTVAMGGDIFNRGVCKRYAGLKLDASFPAYLLKNQDKYQDFLGEANITGRDYLRLKMNQLKSSFLIRLKHSRLYSYLPRSPKTYE